MLLYYVPVENKKTARRRFDESRKAFSGTFPESKNCSQAIFATADLLKSANTSRSFLGQYTFWTKLCNAVFFKKWKTFIKENFFKFF